jgi:hypothetical protein
MKINKIFMMIIVMILLVSVVFGKDETTWSSERRFTTDGVTYTGTKPSGAYFEITKTDGTWNMNQYNAEGQRTNSYTSTNVPDPTNPSASQLTGQLLTSHDVNNDGDTRDPGERSAFYSYADPDEGLGQGLYDKNNNYFDDSRNYLGTNYDPETRTYQPTENDNIVLGTDGSVYVDRNGDNEVDINDIDLDGDEIITDYERTLASVSLDYNHESGRYSLSEADDMWWVDENRRIYITPYRSDEDEIATDFTVFQDGSISYRSASTGKTNMFLSDGSPALDVTPDREGGYYQDVFYTERVAVTSDYTIYGGDEVSVHFVSQDGGGYVGVIDRAGADYIFNDNDRNGVPDGSIFTIDSDVSVSDESGTYIVVQSGEDFYAISGNEELNELVIGDARQLNEDDMEEIFGRNGVFFMSAYGTYRLGVLLDDFRDVVQGYPGFSVFYSDDLYNDWLNVLDNEFINTLFGGVDQWGETLCSQEVTQDFGSNVATGADPTSPSAFVIAEQYQRPNPENPAQTQYLYMIEFEVYAGQGESACTALDFQTIIKYASGAPSRNIFRNSETQTSWIWELEEEDRISYTGENMWLATSTSSLEGSRVCVRFETMEPDFCIPQYNDGNNNELCDTITIAGQESHDYDCDGWYCQEFWGFFSAGLTPGREGWSFPSQTGSEQTGGVEADNLDTTFDPVSGVPVMNLDP